MKTKNSKLLGKTGEKLKEAYSLALTNKYDITSEKDVLEILKVIDPAHTDQEYIKNFSKLLQLFDLRVKQKTGTKIVV